VPIDATKKTGKKTSCMVDFIVSMALRWVPKYRWKKCNSVAPGFFE
jgi:hypothetical protein